MSKLTLVLSSAFILLVLEPFVHANEVSDSGVTRDLGTDHFAAGSNTRVMTAVAGDALLAGRDIDVLAEIGGDLAAAGGDVRIEKPVNQGAYVVGHHVLLNSSVGRSVRAAGGTVELGRTARVVANASLAGEHVLVLGPVGGYLQAAGGHILIDSAIGGDVDVAARSIELGPNTRINGKLRYESRHQVKRDQGAQVSGGIEQSDRAVARTQERYTRFGHRAGWVWSGGIIVLSAVLMAALPSFGARLGDTVKSRWGWSLLTGFIALVCIPILALVLLLTIVGIPLALALFAGYFLLLLLGYASSGVAVGDITLRRLAPQHSGQISWRILATALAMFVVILLARIPGLGSLIALAATLTGIGSLLLQLRNPMTAPS